MTTVFPGALDSFTNPNAASGDSLASVPHDAQHSNINDAVKALETKVGINGSADISSLDYKVSNKQNTITLTTTGTSGAATLIGSALNIPQYSGGSSGTFPSTTAAVSHQWLNSYNAATGAFSQTQPASTDISDIATFSLNTSGSATIGSAAAYAFNGRSQILSPSDGIIELTDSTAALFTRLQFGGTTASFPALKRNTTALNVRLADDSADANLTCGQLTASGTIQGISAAALVIGPSAAGAFWNMPTSGASGIGVGSLGTSGIFAAYCKAAGNYFSDAAIGDLAYRSATGTALRFGASGSTTTMFVTSTGVTFNNAITANYGVSPFSITTAINAKTVANTLLYTNATGKTLIVTKAIIRVSAASAITNGPTIGIGSASGTSDIFPSTALNALTTTTTIYGFDLIGMSVSIPNTGTVYLNLSTVATGTSETIVCDLHGYFV